MTAPELKPCPFCGGEAMFGDGPDGAFVNCPDCLASVQTLLPLEMDRAEAAARWNTRAPLAEALAVPEVAALVEALRQIDSYGPDERHNHNRNDLIACEAVMVARAALRAIGVRAK